MARREPHPSIPNSFADLSVQIPLDHVLDEGPLDAGLANAFPVEIHRDPQDEDGGTDAGHGAERVNVSVFLDPLIRVEGEEEAKSSWWSEAGLALVALYCWVGKTKNLSLGHGDLHLNPNWLTITSPATGR